jgi:hypothetical protein
MEQCKRCGLNEEICIYWICKNESKHEWREE